MIRVDVGWWVGLFSCNYFFYKFIGVGFISDFVFCVVSVGVC